MEQPIATLALLGSRISSREEFQINIAIGTPYPRGNGSWACPVELRGLHDRVAEIVGEDSLQALSLAVQFAGKLLADFVQRGGRLRSPGDDPDDSFPLGAYFSNCGPSSAGGAA